MSWNVWSILNSEKLDSFLQVLDDNGIHIACITETWFDSRNGKFTSTIKNAGYDLVHSYRENKRGGGTAVIYKNNLLIKKGESSASKYESFEFSYTHLNDKSSRIILICIYRKQEISCKTFCKEFETFMDSLPDKTDEMIIVGDFNLWADAEENTDFKMFETLMNAYGLEQVINKPTHRNGHILDHLYINQYETSMTFGVMDSTFGISTDHLPCMMNLPRKLQLKEEEYVKTRKLKNIDMDIFKEKINTIVNEAITKETDFEQCYSEFKQKVENVMDILAPEVTIKLSNKNDPKWFDQEFKKARALRRKLERKWRKSRSIEDHNRYIEQRNLCAKLSLTKQESYYSSIIESSSNKQKSLFKVVNEVLDKKEDRILPTHNDPIKLANKFNLYYIDKIDKLRESIPPSDDNQAHVQNPFNGIKLDNFSPTTAEEVRQIFKEYGVKTSSEDPLPASLIKSTLDELIPIYVHLVNKSLADGTMNGINIQKLLRY